MEMVSWATPLLVLPGVGLLLISTSARFESIHTEIHALLRHDDAGVADCARDTAARSRLLVSAMISLYIAASCLAVSALLGALDAGTAGDFSIASRVLLASGVVALVFATFILVMESLFTARVVRKHAREIGADSDVNTPG